MTNNKLYIKSRRPINMNENFKEELERLIPIAEQMWIDWRGKLPDDYVSPLK